MGRFFIGAAKILAGVMLLALLAVAVFSPAWAARPQDVKVAAFTPIPTAALFTAAAADTPDAVTPTPAPTATPSPTPTPTPTPEPTPITYTISFVGDCTLASYPEIKHWESSFENVVNGNWAYPFANTAELFLRDDLTVANLECSISDLTAYAGTTFSFLAPSAAVEILTLGGVEAATMANNHAMDFGQAVYDDTAANLDAAGIVHCGDGEGMIYTTASGLKVGIYATYNGHWPVAATVAQGVNSLRDQGAEVVAVCAHWGDEASYYTNANQVEVAHAAIDAGADIVVGHGPHRLERYEEYGSGVIFYSLSNFVFGGNTGTDPKFDLDTVIAQVIFERSLDGVLSLKEVKALPCSISSREKANDYCPTLYEKGTEAYDRAMSKVDGTWNGANPKIDYSFMH